MAGRRPDSKLSSYSTGFYHWSLGADASGSFDLESKFDSFPPPIGSFIHSSADWLRAWKLQKYDLVTPVSYISIRKVWRKNIVIVILYFSDFSSILSNHQEVLLILVEREREEGKRLKRRRVAHFFISCLGEPRKLLFHLDSLKSFMGSP